MAHGCRWILDSAPPARRDGVLVEAFLECLSDENESERERRER